MKITKQRIFMFVGIVLAVVAITLLMIFVIFPEPKLTLAYDSSVEILQIKSVKETTDSVPNILTNLERVENTTLKNEINNKTQIINSLKNYNNNLKSGLYYNQRSKKYNELAKKLNSLQQEVKDNFDSARAFANETLNPYLLHNPTSSYNDLMRYVNTFNEKFSKSYNSYISYYTTLSEIYLESAVDSLQANKAVKTNVYLCKIWIEEISKVIIDIDNNTLIKLNNQLTADYSNESTTYSDKYWSFVSSNNIKDFVIAINSNSHSTFIANQSNSEQYTDFVSNFIVGGAL